MGTNVFPAAASRTKITVFTESGTFTPDPDAKDATIGAFAGGGGGAGGGNVVATSGGGGGGGGGGVSEYPFDTSASSYAITVAAGGAGGAVGSNGGKGGITSIVDVNGIVVIVMSGGDGGEVNNGSTDSLPGRGGGVGKFLSTIDNIREGMTAAARPTTNVSVGDTQASLTYVFPGSPGGASDNGNLNGRGSHNRIGVPGTQQITLDSGGMGGSNGAGGAGGARQVPSLTGLPPTAGIHGGGGGGGQGNGNPGASTAGAAGGDGIVIIKEFF